MARPTSVTRRDARWLGLAVLVGAVVVFAYLLSHDYPAYGGGLFVQIADQIRANGYALPRRIPGYTRGGVPFAYPALPFYVAAAVRDLTGVDAVTYTRLVPGTLVLACLVPYYFLARDLLESERLAGAATALFAVTPAALQWHLSAGGMVRSMALLFCLAGTYAGLRLFRAGDRRWVVPAAVGFGLTVLTHPTYTVFYGLTFVLLWAGFDRSIGGLLAGAAVAAGGVALAAPWWLQVVQYHGFGIFAAAAGTHSGLGGDGSRVVSEFVYPLAPNLEMVFYLGAYPGAAYALSKREWFLPAWLAVPGYVIGKPRFQFVAGSLLTVLLVHRVVLPRVERLGDRALDRGRASKSDGGAPESDGRFSESDGGVSQSDGGTTPTGPGLGAVAAAVLLLSATGVGTAFAAGALDTHGGSATQPAFVDDADLAAMAWAQRTTDPGATFVVLGDAAEWFPVFGDRTIVVGPWGVEWTSPQRYAFQLSFYKSVSRCGSASCLSEHLDRGGFDPTYVYVPKGHYTVRGFEAETDPGMRASMVASERYELAYENEGVMVFRVAD